MLHAPRNGVGTLEWSTKERDDWAVVSARRRHARTPGFVCEHGLQVWQHRQVGCSPVELVHFVGGHPADRGVLEEVEGAAAQGGGVDVEHDLDLQRGGGLVAVVAAAVTAAAAAAVGVAG